MCVYVKIYVMLSSQIDVLCLALSEISRPFKNNGNVIVKNGFFMADRHLKF